MSNKIVKDLGSLYVSMCYMYTTQDFTVKGNEEVFQYLSEVYFDIAREPFLTENLEFIPKEDITSSMLFGLIDSLHLALDLDTLETANSKIYKHLDRMCNLARTIADSKLQLEMLLGGDDGEDLDIVAASKILEEFMNGSWIQTLVVQRPGLRKGSSSSIKETFGIYNKSKNTARSLLDDEKPYVYTCRANSIAAWFAKEIKNYSTYLKSKASDGRDEDDYESNFLSELLSGHYGTSKTSTERDWAEGDDVDISLTGHNIPGVALRIDPVIFTKPEVQYMASQVAVLNELANKVDGLCTTPDTVWFGKHIKVDLASRVSKFSKETKFNDYNLDLVNIDRPATALVSQIKTVLAKPEKERPSTITALFYGVPGSGKSLLANYLGDQLKTPVIKRTYAELQSMYVGEGEKNLREAFAEAESEGAILLIDELDSIAGNRKDADKNYQKTFVNQLLTELDEFKGIFIATSNFLDSLDPAVLRRLFLKIKFDFLTEDQVEICFKQYFPDLKRSKLGYMKYLTPGDFKAVREATLFEESKVTVKRVRELLNQEVTLKKSTLGEVISSEKTVGYHL
jgi:hypothetical protein